MKKIVYILTALGFTATAHGQNSVSGPMGVYTAQYAAATYILSGVVSNGGSVLVGSGGNWYLAGNITSNNKSAPNSPNATGRAESITFTGTGTYTNASSTIFVNGYAGVFSPSTSTFVLPIGDSASSVFYAPVTMPQLSDTNTMAYFPGPGSTTATTVASKATTIFSPYLDATTSSAPTGSFTFTYPLGFTNKGNNLLVDSTYSGSPYTSLASALPSWVTAGSTVSSSITISSGTSRIAFATQCTVSITASASQTVACATPVTTVNLTSTPTGGITPYASFAWTETGTGTITTTSVQNPTTVPTSTGTYTVKVTDAAGCIATATTGTVTYDPATPSIALSCGKNSSGMNYAQLSENSGIATSWLWTTTSGGRFYADNTLSASNDSSTSTSQVTYVDYNGGYAVAITDANGCNGSGSVILNSGSCTYVLATGNLNFTVVKKDNTALLDWSTASETNNSYFNIERSADGTTWQVIGTVNGQGNSSTLSKYSFTDVLPLAGGNYYRLKQVDVNGLYSYSPVKYLVFTGQWLVKLYPNPVQNYLVLEFNNDKDEKANIVIQSVLGKTVFATQQQLAKGLNRIVLNQVQLLANGTYMLVMGTTENTFRSKFVKGGN